MAKRKTETTSPETSDRDARSVLIPIDAIELHLSNHRHPDLHDQGKLDALAASMAEHGLLQPILVHGDMGGDRYRLVYGHRRLAAAKQLGWARIRAEVRPAMDDAQVLLERAIENLHRADLNPMEEIVAVEQALAALGGDVKRAARELGLSVQFVRDRALLGRRLAPKAREIALEGYLRIGHLRELVKVVDHRSQDNLADELTQSWRDEGRIVPSVERVRNEVETELADLSKVPWRLDVAVGERPPCVGCPHNTNAQPELFGEASGPGRCTDHACFSDKMQASNQAKRKIVERFVKQKETPPATDVVAAAGDVGASYLEPKTVLREVKREQKWRRQARSPQIKLTPLQKAIDRYGRAMDKWRGDADKRIQKAIDAHPLRYVAGLVLRQTDAWRAREASDVGFTARHGGKHRGPRPDRPLSDALRRAILMVGEHSLTDLERLAELPHGRRYHTYRRWTWASNVAVAVALGQALGVELPDPPDWGQMQPKPQKKTGKRRTKKKPTPKRVTKRSTRKEAAA